MKKQYLTFTLLAVAAVVIIGVAVGSPSRSDEAVSLSELPQATHIHGIGVDREDPSRLYLATHHGLFAASLGDGTATRVSEDRNDYMGFTPHPTEPLLYASGHPEGGGNLGVIASRDDGRTWERLAGGANGPVDFHAMDISPADPGVMYGLYGDIQVSRDGGKTWAVAGAPPADVFDLAASARDPNTLYAATGAGLLVSRDAGKSWEPAFMLQRPASLVETDADGTLYAFVVGTGLVKAEEPGLSWETVNADWGERVLLHLAVDPGNPERLFAVTDEGGILASTDGGQSWAALTS